MTVYYHIYDFITICYRNIKKYRLKGNYGSLEIRVLPKNVLYNGAPSAGGVETVLIAVSRGLLAISRRADGQTDARHRQPGGRFF